LRLGFGEASLGAASLRCAPGKPALAPGKPALAPGKPALVPGERGRRRAPGA
jgi:hypothetical protein